MGIRNRALHNGHWMSPSWAILLTVIHAMFNLTDVTSHVKLPPWYADDASITIVGAF